MSYGNDNDSQARRSQRILLVEPQPKTSVGLVGPRTLYYMYQELHMYQYTTDYWNLQISML